MMIGKKFILKPHKLLSLLLLFIFFMQVLPIPTKSLIPYVSAASVGKISIDKIKKAIALTYVDKYYLTSYGDMKNAWECYSFKGSNSNVVNQISLMNSVGYQTQNKGFIFVKDSYLETDINTLNKLGVILLANNSYIWENDFNQRFNTTNKILNDGTVKKIVNSVAAGTSNVLGNIIAMTATGGTSLSVKIVAGMASSEATKMLTQSFNDVKSLLSNAAFLEAYDAKNTMEFNLKEVSRLRNKYNGNQLKTYSCSAEVVACLDTFNLRYAEINHMIIAAFNGLPSDFKSYFKDTIAKSILEGFADKSIHVITNLINKDKLSSAKKIEQLAKFAIEFNRNRKIVENVSNYRDILTELAPEFTNAYNSMYNAQNLTIGKTIGSYLYMIAYYTQ